MSKPALTLYFGVYLDGTEDQFELSDTSAGTKIQFRLPAGYYFFHHDEGIKDILNVLNIVFSGYMANSRVNDRQLVFKFTDPTDTLLLLKTENQDADKLAELLGLYDNNGNLDYYQGADIVHNTIGQCNMCTWYSASGRVFRSPSERGLYSHLADYYIAQSGHTAGISTGHVSTIKDLAFTSIDADDVRVHDLYGTQDTLGVTENNDWTTSLWSAYNPALHAPVFTAEFTDRSGDTYGGEWWITNPIEPQDCVPTNQNYAGLFDLVVSANYLPLQTRDRAVYCSAAAPHWSSKEFNIDSTNLANKISIVIKALHVVWGDASIVFGPNESGGSSTTGSCPGAYTRISGWLQHHTYGAGSVTRNQSGVTNAAASGKIVTLILTREGNGAGSEVNIYDDLTNSALNYPISQVQDTSYDLRIYYAYGNNLNTHYLLHGSIYDRILTAAEITRIFADSYPDPSSSLAFYKFDEYGGDTFIDWSGNGLHLMNTSAPGSYTIQWEDWPL